LNSECPDLSNETYGKVEEVCKSRGNPKFDILHTHPIPPIKMIVTDKKKIKEKLSFFTIAQASLPVK